MSISFKFKLLIALGVVSELSLRACAQPATKQVLQFPAGAAQPVLVVDNPRGLVKIEAHDGPQVELEIVKVWKNEDPELQKEAQAQVREVVEQSGDSLIVYVHNPQDIYCDPPGQGWRPRWQVSRRYQRWYDFRFDITVRVPRQAHLLLYAANQGDLVVNGVQGKIEAHHTNGSIRLEQVAQVVAAHTMNGSVVVRYASNPSPGASYRTINGDIELYCPAALATDVIFQTKRGDFFTNFDAVEATANLVEKKEQANGGTIYQLNRARTVRIGGGGPPCRLETMNGNLYVKKI
jgi:hypothetical protein